MNDPRSLLILLAIALAAIIMLVIALAVTLRAGGRRHSFSVQRSPSVVDPKRTLVRAAAEAPQRAEAANPTASAPGLQLPVAPDTPSPTRDRVWRLW